MPLDLKGKNYLFPSSLSVQPFPARKICIVYRESEMVIYFVPPFVPIVWHIEHMRVIYIYNFALLGFHTGSTVLYVVSRVEKEQQNPFHAFAAPTPTSTLSFSRICFTLVCV